MGCDIHAHIEVVHNGRYTKEFPIHTERDYDLFGIMAGVRGGGCIIQPRGFPSDASTWAVMKYTLFIGSGEGEGVCSKERADFWVRDGYSTQFGDDAGRITSPDHHTASWLTLTEMRGVRQKYSMADGANSLQLDLMIISMETIYRHMNIEPRIVFWFDN